MSKLDELKSIVANLFEAATDKDQISQISAVKSKVDEVALEQEKAANDYKELLKDYKDVVVHSSYTPKTNEVIGDGPSIFDANQALEDVLKQFDGK